MKVNLSNVKAFAKTAVKYAERKAPVIAAGAAITLMAKAVWEGVKAAPEAKEAIFAAENKKNEQALVERLQNGDDSTPIVPLTWKEKCPIYAKHYWKTVLCMLLSASAMCASVYFSNRKIKALAVIAAAAESNIDSLEKAVADVVGEKKVKEIKDKLIDNKIEEIGDVSSTQIIKTGNGDTLCLEYWYGTYFESSIPSVKTAIADYELEYARNNQVFMDDLYHGFCIPDNCIPGSAGKEGHFADPDEGITYPPEIEVSSKLVRFNGEERTCYVIKTKRPRIYDDLFNEAMAKRSFR